MERKSRFTPICCANRTPVLEGLQDEYRRVAAISQNCLPAGDKEASTGFSVYTLPK
jgi:hypothetical protein